MSIKVGINGFGRIARVILRASLNMPEIDIKAMNVRSEDLEYMVYMLKYDTTFGRFPGEVSHDETNLILNGKKIPVYRKSEAVEIPWGEADVDYVIDCTGAYLTTEACMAHINNGAKHVIISAPAKDTETPTFVYGVNHETYTSDMKIVSNASCTTNCLAPLMKVMYENFGIKEGLMSTIHSSTSKQTTVDAKSLKDWRIGRSVYGNIIPSSTGAAKAVGKVIPELKGKLTGISFRVPTIDASVVDVCVVTEKPTTAEEIKEKMKEAANGSLKGVLEYCEDEVVSGDFIGYPITSVFDSKQLIALNDHFFKLIAYYDNEYGYSTNLLNMLKYMGSVDNK